SGPAVSPVAPRRNCSKNGIMAAGFSIGMLAVRSSIPETSSDARARALALTGGALRIRARFFAGFFTVFVFFALEVLPAASNERTNKGVAARIDRAATGRSHRMVCLARKRRTFYYTAPGGEGHFEAVRYLQAASPHQIQHGTRRIL